MVHAKKEEEEKINVRYDVKKKFLYKPQVMIICIM